MFSKISPSLVIVPLVFLDQASKLLVSSFLPTSCNLGFAFGLLPSEFNWAFHFLVLALVFLLFLKEKQKLRRWGLSLILAGGISNLWDRISAGCVVDFIDLGFWPAFNMADAMIFFGAAFLIVRLVKSQS